MKRYDSDVSASAMITKLEKLNIGNHLACNEEAIKELTKNEKKYYALVNYNEPYMRGKLDGEMYTSLIPRSDCINFYAFNKKEAIEYLKDLYRHIELQDNEIIELKEVK